MLARTHCHPTCPVGPRKRGPYIIANGDWRCYPPEAMVADGSLSVVRPDSRAVMFCGNHSRPRPGKPLSSEQKELLTLAIACEAQRRNTSTHE